MLRKRIHFIALVLALFIPTAIVAAATSATVGNFQVDLVSHVSNPDDTDTFTYAVTAIAPTQALSHWTLGMETCVDHLVSPQDGPYSTITNIDECGDGTYACEAASYTVVTGDDPTLGIYGIKFEDGLPQLIEGNTHVFQITVAEFAYLEEVDIGAKYGGSQPTGQIDGPVCGITTAVSLASTSVNSATFAAVVPLLLALMGLLMIITLSVLRRPLARARAK